MRPAGLGYVFGFLVCLCGVGRHGGRPAFALGELVLLLVAARLWVLSTALPVPLLDDLPPLWCILVKSGHPASAVPAADVAQW